MMAARNKALADYMQSTHGAAAPVFRVQTLDSVALQSYTGRDRYTIALEVDGETVEVEAEDDGNTAGSAEATEVPGTNAGEVSATDAAPAGGTHETAVSGSPGNDTSAAGQAHSANTAQ